MRVRTLGVEEELLVVDAVTGRPRAVAAAALEHVESPADGDDGDPVGAVVGELMLQQLETGTRPCRTLHELDEELGTWRRRADAAAGEVGCRVAALPTSPVPVVPETTPSPRYQRMAEEFGLTQAEQLVCGCHVHVSVESDEEGVGVLDRIRTWLPTLVAVSAGSPYWQGLDTGYASYRSQIWRRWPSAGATEVFGSAEAYHGALRRMLDTGSVLDEGMVYLDARLARSYPTIEIRVADVCADRDTAVLVAGLVRGLVETAAGEWRAGTPPHQATTMEISLATWRAARSGLAGDLVDPASGRPRPAGEVLGSLVEHVRPALEEYGDLARVQRSVGRLLEEGTVADRQRAVMAAGGDAAAVVRAVVELTAR